MAPGQGSPRAAAPSSLPGAGLDDSRGCFLPSQALTFPFTLSERPHGLLLSCGWKNLFPLASSLIFCCIHTSAQWQLENGLDGLFAISLPPACTGVWGGRESAAEHRLVSEPWGPDPFYEATHGSIRVAT